MHLVASFKCTIWTADFCTNPSQAVIGKFFTLIFSFHVAYEFGFDVCSICYCLNSQPLQFVTEFLHCKHS